MAISLIMKHFGCGIIILDYNLEGGREQVLNAKRDNAKDERKCA